MGERCDIIRTMQRAFSAAQVARAPAEQAIYDPSAANAGPLVGRVLARGLADEHRERHYMIVDAADGRSHYVALGREDAEGIGEGMIVRIDPLRAEIREADRMVTKVAAANGGRYDVEAHLKFDKTATRAFVETHIRRLEAIRRKTGGADRMADGSWKIAADHLERAAAYEASILQERPVTVSLLSVHGLEVLAHADSATWLDARLAEPATLPARDAGFGAELIRAEGQRRQWLLAQRLAEEREGRFHLAPDAVDRLCRRELLRSAQTLSEKLDLPFAESKAGERVEGICRQRVDLASGRYALIERSHDFTLVPWRAVLARHLGRRVSGLMRGETISWTIGRGRDGPSIG